MKTGVELIKKLCEIAIHVGLSENTEPTIEGIVEELRLTNCDGCKSFAGELESLSFAAENIEGAPTEKGLIQFYKWIDTTYALGMLWDDADSVVNEYLSLSPVAGEQAQRCPVCGGNGLVPNGFYNTVTGIMSTTSITPETCRSCNGTGIVYPPPRPSPTPQVPPQDTPQVTPQEKPMTAEELYKMLDDKRMKPHIDSEGVWHLYRKQTAEHILDNYAIIPKNSTGSLKPTVEEREVGDRMGIDETVTPDEFRKARNKIQRT
jgi:hypothetical protein